VNVY
jgi:hypothetical protein